MKIFRDCFTNDELGSDGGPFELLYDDTILKLVSKMVSKSEDGKYDIGGNPSEDPDNVGEDESVESTTITVNLLADNHRLQETQFDKKSYTSYIKAYMKLLLNKIQAENPARVPQFQKGAQQFVKHILDKFTDYSFWLGESMDYEKGMVLAMGYEEDGITPFFLLFKDALIEEKV